MSRPKLTIVQKSEPSFASLQFAEKLADHQALLEGYLDTHLTRNHSDGTRERERYFLTGWFKHAAVPDEDHPDGERQLLMWEAMAPVLGRQRIVTISQGLVETGLQPGTRRNYLGALRHLFAYILEYPYIPGAVVQNVIEKYGRIEQPVSVYDYPVHVVDQQEEGFVLTGTSLLEFYDFVRKKYIGTNQKKNTASRDYTMIVLAGESGLRADEICHLDALGPHRDLFYEHNSIQTRYGKGTKGSGRRVRKTIFTSLAQSTARVYEERIRPQFPNEKNNTALFLTESGDRIKYQDAWRSLTTITKAAREAGIVLPQKFSWQSLRKSFATNFQEQHPDQIWLLMEMMGHLHPGTLHRYVKHTRGYYDRALNSIVKELAYIPES